jgi:tetratricopeptide (TPR) repeat protein
LSEPLRRLYEEVTTYGEGSAGDVEEEIEQLESLLEKNPDNLDISEWLAFKLYSVGNFERAVHLYRGLIERGHRTGVQYFYLGNTYFKMKRMKNAVAAWEKTIELIPTDAKAQKARARIERVTSGGLEA